MRPNHLSFAKISTVVGYVSAIRIMLEVIVRFGVMEKLYSFTDICTRNTLA